MSFLFGGQRPQPSSAEKIAMAEAELDLIQDMYNKCVHPSHPHPPSLPPLQCFPNPTTHTNEEFDRLATTCTRKCLPADYREADLNKGESVCLDRCVAKYMETNIKIGEKMQGDAQARGMGQGGGATGGGGMFGR